MSGEGSSQGGARDNKEKRNMKNCLKLIIELISEQKNKNLLTKTDLMNSFRIWESDLEKMGVILSWKTKSPSLMCASYIQQFDECWSVALSRAISILMKMNIINEKYHPTPDVLIDGVGVYNLSSDYGINDIRVLISYFTSNFVDNMTIHHRPQLDDEEQNEEFEKCIIRLLATTPLAICFDHLPSYGSEYDGIGIYIPTEMDFQSRLYERIPRHCALLTGVGVEMRDGEAIEFWEMQESRGGIFGDAGYIRFARHKCLIREVYELGALKAHFN